MTPGSPVVLPLNLSQDYLRRTIKLGKPLFQCPKMNSRKIFLSVGLHCVLRQRTGVAGRKEVMVGQEERILVLGCPNALRDIVKRHVACLEISIVLVFQERCNAVPACAFPGHVSIWLPECSIDKLSQGLRDVPCPGEVHRLDPSTGDHQGALDKIDRVLVANVLDVTVLCWQEIVGQPAIRDASPLNICLVLQHLTDRSSRAIVEPRLVRVCLNIARKLRRYEAFALQALLAGLDEGAMHVDEGVRKIRNYRYENLAIRERLLQRRETIICNALANPWLLELRLVTSSQDGERVPSFGEFLADIAS